MEDIQELKPTIFCGVPRVYDRIYSGILICLCIIFFHFIYITVNRVYLSSFFVPIVGLEFLFKGIERKISSGGAFWKTLFQYAYN